MNATIANGQITFQALPYPLPDWAQADLRYAARYHKEEVPEVEEHIRSKLGVHYTRPVIRPTGIILPSPLADKTLTVAK